MSQRSKGVFLLYLHYFVVLFLLCFVLWRVSLIGWLADLQEDDINNKDIDEQIVEFLGEQKNIPVKHSLAPVKLLMLSG